MLVKSVVFLHAHPDDEALLSGGTLRALHQMGMRTIVIFLTNGQRGLTNVANQGDLGAKRQREALKSSAILGVSKTYFLGYEDSGLGSREFTLPAPALLAEMSEKIREILDNERPIALVGYDSQGGYGHPDHKLVHHLVRQIHSTTAIASVLEVTIDRSIIASTLERFRHLILLLDRMKLIRMKDISSLADGFSASADIAYKVNVKAFASAKRAALKSHVSQSVGGIRNIKIITMLPLFLFKRFFGTEWFVAIRDSEDNPLKLLQ